MKRIIVGILTVLFFILVLIPGVIEEKLFGSKWINNWVDWLIDNNRPKDYIKCLDADGRYHNPEVLIDKSDIYTRNMYDRSLLPNFYFTQEFKFKKGLDPFRWGDNYPTYAYTYEVLIDLLNKNIITTDNLKYNKLKSGGQKTFINDFKIYQN